MAIDGQLTAIRWAIRSKKNDPDWGKWHLIHAGDRFTACGQLVRLFEVDGSPQEGPMDKISCKHCLQVSHTIGWNAIELAKNQLQENKRGVE